MGALLNFPWPKRKTKYSLALECQSCGNRQVVEPEVHVQRMDEQNFPVIGEYDVMYGDDADKCRRCSGTNLRIVNPTEWNDAPELER